ncbi:class I adenylate-forming enzyme family protein [Agromyces cerinus]|uniref:Acyl-CoA synthetase (AMP-forming)/AMP-acid ligase II n=1 Tax=Agromyces cerinus subsp. cerinus TaxID=232089 RepID=A0A1N6DX60_9MICO|nr:class I adenylate-forming enzyme family protein [Agromyces cerinus]SIN75369.1 Acyl-CoA synthetase (AMP-forming)/AMP-acid ligase II [Agromyces cerinus subsp. cerinus]
MTTQVLDGARTVGDVLDAAAERHGDRVAVQDATGSLTFTELRERARRLADGLLRSGLRPGDRVLEALPNGCELLVSEMALALAGLVRVPLNPRLGPREWRGIHHDSGARGLIADGRLRGGDGAGITEHVACEIRVRADDGGLAELIDDGSPGARLVAPNPEDVVGLAYSSGTTGMPKGALRTHGMRLASMRAMLRHVVEPTGDVDAYLHAGPAIHTSGLFILPMLALGARQVMAHHPTPAAISELVAAASITHLALVPSVVDALTQLPEPDRRSFARLRMLAYAGAPMPPAQIRRAAELLTDRLVQYYGLVEAIPPLTVLGIADHARGLGDTPQLLASAGRIVGDARIEIRRDGGSADTGPVPSELGEVAVSGPMVTPGYWNAEERTDLGKSFDGTALLTGDVGVITDGYLVLADRRNNMLISGGYNVYPGEIESAVLSSPGLRDAVAVGLPDERWGQRIVLAYTTTSGADLDASQRAELHDRLDRLAPHKRPKTCHFHAELPLGATGKLDRRAIAAQLIAAEHPLSGASDERLPTT